MFLEKYFFHKISERVTMRKGGVLKKEKQIWLAWEWAALLSKNKQVFVLIALDDKVMNVQGVALEVAMWHIYDSGLRSKRVFRLKKHNQTNKWVGSNRRKWIFIRYFEKSISELTVRSCTTTNRDAVRTLLDSTRQCSWY